MPYSATHEIQLSDATIKLRKDGIVHVYFHAYTTITVELQTQLIEAYWSLVTAKCGFIFEAGEFTSVTKEARENTLLIEDSSPVIASAIVVHNLGQKILADYYYKANKPKFPLKVFRDFETGIDWLKTLEI